MNIKEKKAGREIDDLVVTEVMGWVIEGVYYINKVTEFTTEKIHRNAWKPSLMIAAAYQMEERITELGLINRYCWELIKNAANKEEQTHTRQSWALIHATPEDRCRAALKAIKIKNEKRKKRK